MRFWSRNLPFAVNASGSFSVMFALSLPVLLGAAAFGVDVGSAYLERRSLQAAVDAAALAAAIRPEDPVDVVRRVMSSSGHPNAKIAVIPGEYRNDPTIDRDSRFVAGSGRGAVRVKASVSWSSTFGRVLGFEGAEISAQSDAAIFPTVTLSVGSRLASVDPILLNAILTPLSGADVNLVAADYQWLAKATINAGPLLSRIAPSTADNLEPTASEVLDQPIRLARLITAMAEELTADGNFLGASILRKASYAPLALSTEVDLRDILAIDGHQGAVAARYPASALQARLSVLDLLAAAIRPHGIGNAITVKAGLPGLASARIDMLVGEGMQTARSIATGGIGTRISTDQVRLRLTIETADAVSGLGRLRLPLEAAVAGGSAEVVAASCSPRTYEREVRVSVLPGLARVSIGQFAKPLEQINVGDRLGVARILDLLVARIDAGGNVALEQTRSQILVFQGSEIGNGTIKTVRTSTLVDSLVSSLLEQTRIDVRVFGLGLSVSVIQSAAAGLLKTLTPQIDDLVGGVLAIAGVGLGELDVRIDELSCNTARLVG